MINADFENFFHQISYDWVLRLFSRDVFSFNEDLADLLARLTTYSGRLAMGAPTSPVLSNLAAIPFDKAVADMARTRQWTFTRFADDLTFSADECIGPAAVQEFRHLATSFGLVFNEAKFAVRSPSVPKLVTGLVVASHRAPCPIHS